MPFPTAQKLDVTMPPELKPALSMLGTRTQLAFVVPDLEAAIRYWTECMKVGPFVVIEKSVGDRKVIHRGRETDMDYSLGFSYLGDVQIELIWQFNDAPSPYREFLDSGRQGLHHIAFWPADFEGACDALEKCGFQEVCSMYLRDGTLNVAYYDTPGLLGAMVEIVPMTPARMAYFGRIQKLARTWDGTRPLRRFANREEFLASGEGAD